MLSSAYGFYKSEALWNIARKNLRRSVGDQHIVFNAYAAKLKVLLHQPPIDAFTKAEASLWIVQNGRYKIKPGLNRRDVAGRQRQVHSEITEGWILILSTSREAAARIAHA